MNPQSRNECRVVPRVGNPAFSWTFGGCCRRKPVHLADHPSHTRGFTIGSTMPMATSGDENGVDRQILVEKLDIGHEIKMITYVVYFT